MKFKTDPKHWLDYLLWPLLRWVWEPFSKKRAHFWHWLKSDRVLPQGILLEVEPDRNAKGRSGLWTMLVQTNFAWKTAAIIEPSCHSSSYRVGFISQEEGMKKVCSIVVCGQVAVLVGPYQVKFFGLSWPQSAPISLKLVALTTKYDLGDIPLL